MKLEPLLEEKKKRRIKMIITESQFRILADSVYQNSLNEHEKLAIRNARLIKTYSYEQKK